MSLKGSCNHQKMKPMSLKGSTPMSLKGSCNHQKAKPMSLKGSCNHQKAKPMSLKGSCNHQKAKPMSSRWQNLQALRRWWGREGVGQGYPSETRTSMHDATRESPSQKSVQVASGCHRVVITR